MPAAIRGLVRAISAIAPLAFAANANAELVVRVIDGDSIVVASAGKLVDIRLADIDAPEGRQARGKQAHAALESLVGGKEVRLQLVGGDTYRRILAHVFADDVDVNGELVKRGLAWVRRAYDPPAYLLRYQDDARAAKRGLWADADPIPPWDWRKGKRPSQQTGAAKTAFGTTAATSQPLSRHSPDAEAPAGRQAAEHTRQPAYPAPLPRVRCGTKQYCREMSSCAEAVAFLHQCAVATIDGDDDGIPCEAICRRSSTLQIVERR